uniref:Ig-like domain-containing protein n=1 Tax=Astyanax mexicanus TaxID=7994 RepID=A0A8B9GVI3_ASTMX
MITVFISFYLFVLAYDVGLQVQTEKIGENVTIKCEQSFIKDSKTFSFAWFKQSYGKLPQLVVRLVNNNSNVRYTRQFQQRFNTSLKGDQFFLNIQETVEEDSGTYFCGRVKRDVTEFGSGTLLIFNGKTVQEITVCTGSDPTQENLVQESSSLMRLNFMRKVIILIVFYLNKRFYLNRINYFILKQKKTQKLYLNFPS